MISSISLASRPSDRIAIGSGLLGFNHIIGRARYRNLIFDPDLECFWRRCKPSRQKTESRLVLLSSSGSTYLKLDIDDFPWRIRFVNGGFWPGIKLQDLNFGRFHSGLCD